MRTLMTGPAWVAYGQIYVESAEGWGELGECFGGQQNGLCGAAIGGRLFLITGLHTGRKARRHSTAGAAKGIGRWI